MTVRRPPAAAPDEPARLVDAPPPVDQASARWALDLLADAEPYSPPAGQRERLWRAVEARRRRPAGRLRPALATVVVIAAGLFASAALAGWPSWLARTLGTARPAASAPPTLAPPPVKTLPPAPPMATPEQVPAEAKPPSSGPAEPPVQREAPSAPRRTLRPATTEDASPLLEAMRALRVDHDPARARLLLAAYLERHPRGALAEEALVMLVEAAVAHRDGDASTLAARYFKLYPNGPFRGQVERTVAGTGEPRIAR